MISKDELNQIRAQMSLIDETDEAFVIIKLNKDSIVSMISAGHIQGLSFLKCVFSNYIAEVLSGRRR